jgi:LysR family transcriptional regulator, hydrogen peroxide-inducible genes activator
VALTLRELRYLVALADRAHFGRAAEDCHVSQPTMSTQIRKLEEYLGATLIERNTKSISLTPLGQEVVEQARQIVSRVDALLVSARTPREPLAGPLHLGLIPTLAPYFLPWFIPQVKFRYPRLQLVVHEDQTRHLLECLRSHQIDAALLALPVDGDDLENLPLFDEPFWFACPLQHSLARRKAVTETDHLPTGGRRFRLHPTAGTGNAPAVGHRAEVRDPANARRRGQSPHRPGLASRLSQGGGTVPAGRPGPRPTAARHAHGVG